MGELTNDQKCAQMLKAMLPKTSVTNDIESLKLALGLHEWLDGLINGRTKVVSAVDER